MPKRPSTCQRVVPADMPKQDCLRRHAKKIASVDMQKNAPVDMPKEIVSVDMQKNVPVDMPNKIVSVDMQKRLFLSTCKKRLSPSTCKKDSSRRHAKNCHRRHANTVVVDMPKPGCPPTCQNPSSTSLELSPSTCQGVLSVNLPRGLVRSSTDQTTS
jgi:hypothetical protein